MKLLEIYKFLPLSFPNQDDTPLLSASFSTQLIWKPWEIIKEKNMEKTMNMNGRCSWKAESTLSIKYGRG